MTDKAVSALTSLTGANTATGDLIYIVDISEAAAADRSKKITLGNLFVSIPAGTAGAPSIAAQGDQNTGIWFPAADSVAISVGGTQAMTLDASGNLGIGTTSPNSPTGATQITLHISNATAGTSPGVHITNGDTGTNAGDGTLIFVGNAATTGSTSLNIYNQENSPICFFTATTEKARITSGGDFLVGKNGSDVTVAGCEFGAYGAVLTRDGDALLVNRQGSDGAAVTFRRSNTTVGTISVTTTATAYNTSSDYRLKDNQQPLTSSGAFIDALQPKTWNWKADGTKGVGFIAHEVQSVSPGSVMGEKDAVDADGKPVMQAMEYGSAEFIANIIAELQSLRARVAQLEQGN